MRPTVDSFISELIKPLWNRKSIPSVNNTSIKEKRKAAKLILWLNYFYAQTRYRQYQKENYRLISLTFTVINVQNKILASQTQEGIRKIKHPDQVRFSLGMQEWFKQGQIMSLKGIQTVVITFLCQKRTLPSEKESFTSTCSRACSQHN